MSDKLDRNEVKQDVKPANKAPKIITSQDLLAGDKMIIIRHDQEEYRLQLTATGKLILTK